MICIQVYRCTDVKTIHNAEVYLYKLGGTCAPFCDCGWSSIIMFVYAYLHRGIHPHTCTRNRTCVCIYIFTKHASTHLHHWPERIILCLHWRNCMIYFCFYLICSVPHPYYDLHFWSLHMYMIAHSAYISHIFMLYAYNTHILYFASAQRILICISIYRYIFCSYMRFVVCTNCYISAYNKVN